MSGSMCEVWFYHLERSGLDSVLPELLDKTLARGWRAVIRATDPERIEHLDGLLWSYRDDSFLPHGTVEDPNVDRQPILLTTAGDNPNHAQALFLIDGAEPGSLDGYERCILLFDGRDAPATEAARERWLAFKAEGRSASYWRQGTERGWEKQA